LTPSSYRLLIVASKTGYQIRAFGEAAVRAGIEPVFASDRCARLDNPWRDHAIPVRFHAEAPSIAAIVQATGERPVAGVLALGDRPASLAAAAAEALGLPFHPAAAARVAANKWLVRERLAAAGLPAPWHRTAGVDADPVAIAGEVRYPCVLKPLSLSASRGVVRADDPAAFVAAFERVRRLLHDKDVRALRDPSTETLEIEGYLPGTEFAVEGLMDHGRLRVLALFDKPDPLVGPFFEETIYVTPSRADDRVQRAIVDTMEKGVAALGLWHGPVHAECRVNEDGVFLLEVAARPIGGLCARVLRFLVPDGGSCTLEDLLVRFAVGEAVVGWPREARAAGVMMIPVPARGIFRGVTGLDEALAVEGIEEIRITAKPDQRLEPLPEGSSYPGFIFARGEEPARVEASLRAAHARLHIKIDRALALVEP
jgi:hypothetical protein